MIKFLVEIRPITDKNAYHYLSGPTKKLSSKISG